MRHALLLILLLDLIKQLFARESPLVPHSNSRIGKDPGAFWLDHAGTEIFLVKHLILLE